MITVEQLKGICPLQRLDKLLPFVKPLNSILPAYGIDTRLRLQHFLAQAAHETGQFRYMAEIASGEAYEGRADLGNTVKGDGKKFKGRGIFQTTGRANYKAVSLHLFGDERLLNDPSVLSQPDLAVKSAAFYWQSKKLNQYADADDILSITRRINGGTNGLEDRKIYLKLAKLNIK